MLKFMDNLEFGWTDRLPNFLIELILTSVLFLILLYTFIKVVKRKSSFVILGISYGLLIISFIFSLYYMVALIGCFSACFVSVILFANLGELRSFISNPFKRTTAKNGKFGIEKIFDREAAYKEVETAVLALAKTKTGALLTFEKNTSLKDFMSNGVYLHAPLKSELLTTIFYPGTRLHDGATIIHGNEIVASAVFYTPTTKAFAGKYGSRHRAAIGISEVSDSVTVVVSEETGRISFAVNGELEYVAPDNFLNAFMTYMADNDN